MTSSLDSLVVRLEAAASDIGNVPRHELAVLLRRTALRLRNTEAGVLLDDSIADDYLNSTAAEMGMTRSELARKIIIEWLHANTYMPVDIEKQVMAVVAEMNGDLPNGPDGAA